MFLNTLFVYCIESAFFFIFSLMNYNNPAQNLSYEQTSMQQY